MEMNFFDAVLGIVSWFLTVNLLAACLYLPWCIGKWIKAKANYHNARAEYIKNKNELI